MTQPQRPSDQELVRGVLAWITQDLRLDRETFENPETFCREIWRQILLLRGETTTDTRVTPRISSVTTHNAGTDLTDARLEEYARVTARIFQHVRTLQVVEVPEIRPGVVNFNGCIIELDTLSLHDWVLCEQDPGYRGMPPEEDTEKHEQTN